MKNLISLNKKKRMKYENEFYLLLFRFAMYKIQRY